MSMSQLSVFRYDTPFPVAPAQMWQWHAVPCLTCTTARYDNMIHLCHSGCCTPFSALSELRGNMRHHPIQYYAFPSLTCTIVIMIHLLLDYLYYRGNDTFPCLTWATVVVIRVPPAAPITSRTLPVSLWTNMAGAMDDSGCFPGLTEFTSRTCCYRWVQKLDLIKWQARTVCVSVNARLLPPLPFASRWSRTSHYSILCLLYLT